MSQDVFVYLCSVRGENQATLLLRQLADRGIRVKVYEMAGEKEDEVVNLFYAIRQDHQRAEKLIENSLNDSVIIDEAYTDAEAPDSTSIDLYSELSEKMYVKGYNEGSIVPVTMKKDNMASMSILFIVLLFASIISFIRLFTYDDHLIVYFILAFSTLIGAYFCFRRILSMLIMRRKK